MASTLILVSLFILRFTAVSRIRAVSRSDGGPAPRHDQRINGVSAETVSEKIETAKSETEEVKVTMLKNANGAGELKDVRQKAEKPQCTKRNVKEPAAKLKENQKMGYLRANKGLVATVLISAVIIFTVVVAMLVSKETERHSHSEVYNATEIP